MFTIDIAGRTLAYRHLADLHEKLLDLQNATHKRRLYHEGELRRLKSEERTIRKVIRNGEPPAETNLTPKDNQ